MAAFTVGAFGLLFDEQKRVLLCHRRDRDLWNLPGGGVESGETPWQGVIREVKEEVGLDVAVTKLTGIYKDEGRDDIVFSFLCVITGGTPTLSDEADDIAYFAFEKLPQNTHHTHVQRIRDALDEPDTLHMKMMPKKY
jgi:ADP-ribose pyrophosphatase YjhB (NUDIX family)